MKIKPSLAMATVLSMAALNDQGYYEYMPRPSNPNALESNANRVKRIKQESKKKQAAKEARRAARFGSFNYVIRNTRVFH